MLGLVSNEEQEKLFNTLLEYYRKIYPDVEFSTEKAVFDHGKIGEICYAYPGEEIQATADTKISRIKQAVDKGYNAPLVLLKKGEKFILLDGHRRVRVAWEFGVSWPALVIVPSKDVIFGVEEMVLGKIRDLWG